MNKFIALYFIIISLLLISCGNNKKNTTTDNKDTQLDFSNVPQFNEDSAFNYVKKQVDFGPRVSGSEANKKCAEYLVDELKKYCNTAFVQEGKVRAYNGTILAMRNIIGVFNPKATFRILLCSHWDSRPYADWDPDKANHRKPIDGANDGASGVGVIIEIARQMKIKNPGIGIDIVFFDVEDYGPPQDTPTQESSEDPWGLGSQFWARNPHIANYKANYGILLDMVGVPNATFPKEGFSMFYASDVVNKVWNVANQLGYSSMFVDKLKGQITDDHVYVNNILHIPTIDIISLDDNSGTGFYQYWHTLNDNISHVDKNSLKAVGQTLLSVIYTEQKPS